MSPVVRRRRRRGPARALRDALRHRPALSVGAGLLGVVLLLCLWAGWSVWRSADALKDVERSGLILRQQLVEGDAAGARRALEDFQAAASTAQARTDGPTFWILRRLPSVGDDADTLAVTSSVLDDIGQNGLPPVVASAEQVTARAFHPRDHQFPLERIAALEEPARQSEQAFDDAATQLAAVDSSGLLGPLRSRFEQLRSLVTTSRDTLGSAYRAAASIPELLGADGPRRYLLVFENNAELRSTGGLAGSVSLLEARDGRVDIVHQEPSHDFGITERPPIPLTREEKDLFGDALGQYFLDAVLTPDVPRAAELMAAHWAEDRGVPIDGVFLVDPVAVSYLLAGTGPVDVPGYAPVSAATVVEAVENTIYRLTTDFAAHDDYQNAVAKAVFNAFADGRGDAVDVINALAAGVAEGRIRMHSFDREVQGEVAGTMIAGELPEDPAVGVYVNDGTGSKMSYYLEYDVDLVARSCDDRSQELTGSIDLVNDTPPDVADLPSSVTGFVRSRGPDFVPGQQTVVIYLMLPAGSVLQSLEVDEHDLGRPVTFPLEGRTVAPVQVTLRPEEDATVDLVVRTARGHTGAVDLFVTPGPVPGTESRTIRSAC